MFSVEPVYNDPFRFRGFRRLLGGNVITYDSGGFAFLTGKLKKLPNPKLTIYVYRKLGFMEHDFLIQLDLPPLPQFPKEKRIELIKRSAEYYHVMRTELSNVLGVVHGWNRDEIELSFNLISDPDKVGLGSFTTLTGVVWPSRIALGSYVVKSVLNNGRVPRRVVFERLNLAFKILRPRVNEIFMLGGSNVNTMHLGFYLGSKYCDGNAWRIASMLSTIFIPELGRRSIGRKEVSKRLTSEDVEVMRKWWKHYLNPFKDMMIDVFLNLAKQPNREGFYYRALWNAFVTKVEEEIANEYANDPDRYYRYLSKRWESNSFWKNVLKLVRSNYVQTKLTIYLRHCIEDNYIGRY